MHLKRSARTRAVVHQLMINAFTHLEGRQVPTKLVPRCSARTQKVLLLWWWESEVGGWTQGREVNPAFSANSLVGNIFPFPELSLLMYPTGSIVGCSLARVRTAIRGVREKDGAVATAPTVRFMERDIVRYSFKVKTSSWRWF